MISYGLAVVFGLLAGWWLHEIAHILIGRLHGCHVVFDPVDFVRLGQPAYVHVVWNDTPSPWQVWSMKLAPYYLSIVGVALWAILRDVTTLTVDVGLAVMFLSIVLAGGPEDFTND